MMTDEELLLQIEEKLKGFHGQLDHFYETVGMIMAGRLMGWRVMRLVSSRRCWTMATKLFGDPKQLMPERGKYYYKSVGMQIIDKGLEYWDIINGAANRDELPLHERKKIA